MSIDKITPNRLDRSSDFKLIPKTSMVDALNMIITEDNASGDGDNVGDLGVLKNAKGNSAMAFASPADAIAEGEAKIIGSVTDTKLKIIYFFVWHESRDEHGVWAYDPLGKLPGGNYTNAIRKIHKSNLYNFPQHGFVKGDLIYTSQSRLSQGAKKTNEFDKDTILYFTDNTNEPKKLNVSMALTGADDEYNDVDLIDFVTACPKTPLIPITFNFQSDPTVTTSNFKSGPGFQFAYQAIYKDGVESAISPYSDIAFSPGVINQGSNPSVNHIAHNMCVLTIPGLGEEISDIRILARQFNNPELVILDQVENVNPNTQTQYNFYNNRIVKGVSTNEVNKQFDNLPRKAQAQSIVDNRLMYGNYLEGFDNIKTQCSATVSFKERETEMVDFTLNLVHAVSEQKRAHIQEYTGDTPEGIAINKSAGYILDASELPDHINAGTTINVTISVAPNQNFHIYQAAHSYHQSRHKGGFNQYVEDAIDYSDPDSYNGSPWGLPDEDGEITEPYGHQSLDDSGATWLQSTVLDAHPSDTGKNFGVPFAGDNFGVGGAGGSGDTGGINGGQGFGVIAPVWKTELGASTGNSVSVKYGTSASNPLVIKGNTLIFSCSFTMGGSSGAGKDAIVSIVSQLLGGIEPTWGGGVESGFLTIHDVQRTFTYDIDLAINNGDKFIEGSPTTKLITAAMPKTDTYNLYDTPVGCFVVNKAKVTFSLERDDFWRETTGKHQMLRLVIDKIENVDLVTMVKKMWPGQPWQAITKEYLTQGDFSNFDDIFETEAVYDTGENGWHPPLLNTIEDFNYDYEAAYSSWDAPYTATISGYMENEPHAQDGHNEIQSQRFFGYLDFDQDTEGLEQFFRFNRDVYSETSLNQGQSEIFPFSLLDGEAGPGGIVGEDGSTNYGVEGLGVAEGAFNAQAIHYLSPLGFSSVPRVIGIVKYSDQLYFNTGGVPFIGTITTNTSVVDFLFEGTEMFGAGRRSYLPLMQGVDTTGEGDFTYALRDASYEFFPYSNAGEFGINFSKKQPQIEVLDNLFSFIEGGSLEGGFYNRTFKSSANHDFGIIYYDERGRHGFVNHLTTVYVPGYSQQERGGPLYGRSEITLNINHPAPDWAHFYKIAYTKNTSVEKFIQYSVGGAFIEQGADEAIIESSKIYVSLNYLQESGISYVASWGARDPEGGLSMFRKIEGRNQKLRVISAYDFSNNRSYYYNYEFDIIDVVLLGDVDNPLASDSDIVNKPWLQGEFVVIKNNPAAINFDFVSVSSDLNISYWNNNCIVELYTPSKFQEEDERFYYEIGDTYTIDSPGTSNASHSQQNITLTEGDVWWRRVPVNLREYNTDTGLHEDLIQYVPNDPNASSSNFKSYYLETETASDLFKADASLIGRPNLIVEDAVETRREASITYSGQSNPNSSKINYSSFNLTLSNYKDLQEEFGDINYMCNMSGDVFVIQSDKCTLVPASKTLFSDVQGGDTVAASRSPLGQERVFAGRSGCDNNPESAVQVGSYVYFAHKTLGKVFRFNPSNGVQEISDQGMSSYFRDLFKKAMQSSLDINHRDIRVVGGYDPVNDEYLLTVLYELTIEESIPDPVVDDPYVGDVDDVDETEEETEDDVVDETTSHWDYVFFGEGANADEALTNGTGAFHEVIDFGSIERSSAGSQVERTFVITNNWYQDVRVKLNDADMGVGSSLNPFALNSTMGGFVFPYHAPWVYSLVDEDGSYHINPPGQGGIVANTIIPAGTSHTFTLTARVDEQIHGQAGEQFPTGNPDNPFYDGTEMLMDQFGTTFRHLTMEERSNATLWASGNPMGLTPEYKSQVYAEIYDSNFNLLVSGNPLKSRPIELRVVDEIEGDVVSEGEDEGTVDTSVYNADINNDGVVNINDLLDLLGDFGQVGDNLPADINNDGSVSVQDVLELLNQFGNNAPNIDDVIDVPPLDLNAFGNLVVAASTVDIDPTNITSYYELVVLTNPAGTSVLQAHFPEVLAFVSVDGIFNFETFEQVYLTDDSGDYIPYVFGGTVSTDPPVIDWCSVPGIETTYLGNINYAAASAIWNNSGANPMNPQPFFNLFPEEVGEYWLNNPDAISEYGLYSITVMLHYYFGNAEDGWTNIPCE